MKKFIVILLLIYVTVASAQNTDLPLITNIYNRNITSLNGDWHYIIDVQEEGYYDYRSMPIDYGFMLNAKAQNPSDLVEYNFDLAATMKIPGDWNTQNSQLFFYEGTVWFQRYFDFEPQNGKRTFIYFGAVNYDCNVYINGKFVGHHVGGFTPFNYDITEQLKSGKNFVIVKVDNKRDKDAVPTLYFDWWNYGGITRDVMLVNVNDTYLEDYQFKLTDINSKTIQFAAKLNHQVVNQEITLNIPELKISKKINTGTDGTATITLKTKAQLWSPKNPKLYKVQITACNETINDEIGFRKIETRDKKIYLNGEPIFLKGISIHEEKPYGGGRANSKQDADTLLTWAKQLGCNYVRLAHYPHNEYTVREAEKMGILVWSEIPVYWTINWKSQSTLQNAKQQLHDMITRDYNRANIIIWSIANETPHSQERDQFLGELARYAKSLDSTRLISMAMEVTFATNHVNRLQDNMHDLVDIVSFNQYVGWYRDVNEASKMTWEIPYNKPVIISEFGGGAKFGLHGDKNQRWTEEFQENLYIENLAMISKIDGLAGMTPWILKDFRSPRRVLTGIQDYYNMKGLVSDKGERKKAFYILQKWYENR